MKWIKNQFQRPLKIAVQTSIEAPVIETAIFFPKITGGLKLKIIWPQPPLEQKWGWLKSVVQKTIDNQETLNFGWKLWIVNQNGNIYRKGDKVTRKNLGFKLDAYNGVSEKQTRCSKLEFSPLLFKLAQKNPVSDL